MGRHTLLRAFLAVALAFSTVIATGATSAVTEASAAAATDLATTKRDFARRVAFENPVPEVSAEAWNALLSNRGDAAINDFFSTGWAEALKRAAKRIELNNWYVNDIFKYAIPGSHVYRATENALLGTDNDRDLFVRLGYDEAKERDRADDNKRDERLARLSKEDRDFVTQLANNDPGIQVKAAAQRAITGSDTSISLFFKYHWAIGAKLDDERFRRETHERNQDFLRTIEALQRSALAAEAAEREASGEFARKHRQDAITNWEAADEAARKNSVDWLAEQAKADAQAAAWHRIAELARTAPSEQDWDEVLRRAGEGNTSWADEAAEAVRWADTWKAMAEDMRKKADAAKERDH
ncbi:hypothetical protein ABZ345_11825 [Lentzea sp. NPDC005914]|uniref:hypothetical protein n=1 Tax=Lentzea sp. NPDC005914 TaxID=3154572 RepID=UPI0033CBEAE7